MCAWGARTAPSASLAGGDSFVLAAEATALPRRPRDDGRRTLVTLSPPVRRFRLCVARLAGTRAAHALGATAAYKSVAMCRCRRESQSRRGAREDARWKAHARGEQRVNVRRPSVACAVQNACVERNGVAVRAELRAAWRAGEGSAGGVLVLVVADECWL